MEVPTRKISKSKLKKLYKELIQKGIDALQREKIDDIRKCNILNILKNVGSTSTGTYLHYKDVPKETMFGRSIAERTKLEEEDLMKLKENNRT